MLRSIDAIALSFRSTDFSPEGIFFSSLKFREGKGDRTTGKKIKIVIIIFSRIGFVTVTD